MTNYQKFLAAKAIVDKPTGFECERVNDKLFDFQRDITKWSLRRGRACLFEDCGLGKTPQQLEWAHRVCEHTGGNVLILAPLAVSAQTVREAHKFGIEAHVAHEQSEVTPGISVTNYEKLHRFDVDAFTGIVLDECFAPNSLVKVFEHGIVLQKYIKDVRENDTIINAAGRDRVVECHRRRIDRAVKVKAGDQSITASENHPFFTQRGWVCAVELAPGDYLMEDSQALRLVHEGVFSKVPKSVESAILRDILLSEMADAPIENQSEGALRRGCCKEGKVTLQLVQGRLSEGARTVGANPEHEPDDDTGSACEGESDIAGDEAQTFRAWREWSRDDEASAIAVGCSTRRMESGVCLVIGQAATRVSNMLQAGSRERRNENLHRGGWVLPPLSERTGCEEGCEAGFIGVEGIEILEQGHPELEQWRNADGFVYFHDLKAERHPSYSVSGMLVHNSSILKAYDGKTRTQIIEAFGRTPYRLACTATPAPNDYMELGNHAEFVGAMTRGEMLSMFFVHDGGDTSKWRLKGHAESEFWRWVCSWAVNIRKPSDIGYDDGKFILPKLHIHEHVVRASHSMDGFLFALPASSLEERRNARRASLSDRVKLAVDLANSDREQWLIWCNLNSESEALASAINGAIEVTGSNSDQHKESVILGFAEGSVRAMVSKPSICGHGMNLQNCSHMAFVGLSDSYEQFYQAVRRCWRFGQEHEVHAHIITSDLEGAVVANIKRKEEDAQRMAIEMVRHMADITSAELKHTSRSITEYKPKHNITLPDWLKVS